MGGCEEGVPGVPGVEVAAEWPESVEREDEDDSNALPGRRPLHDAGVRLPEEVPETEVEDEDEYPLALVPALGRVEVDAEGDSSSMMMISGSGDESESSPVRSMTSSCTDSCSALAASA